jgi:hypothetical protein
MLPDVDVQVLSIGVDLNLPNRIGVALAGSSSPGRIRLVERLAGNLWRVSLMDQAFLPELSIDAVTSIAFDPGQPDQPDTHIVYVGTDQGLYVGQHADNDWVWERAPGIPDVWVTDLQVHDGSSFIRPTGVLRAATWGRGTFTINRNPIGGWHVADLTAVTGAAAASGDPTGYMFDAQGTQHVNYRGTDGHVYELWWEPVGGWHVADLTAVTGAAAASGDPTGYMFDAQGTQHVNYRGTDGHVYELWWVAN